MLEMLDARSAAMEMLATGIDTVTRQVTVVQMSERMAEV